MPASTISCSLETPEATEQALTSEPGASPTVVAERDEKEMLRTILQQDLTRSTS
jgi:hypothetical protein